mgnify:FL=1
MRDKGTFFIITIHSVLIIYQLLDLLQKKWSLSWLVRRQNLLLNTFFLQAPNKINNHWFMVTVHPLIQGFMPRIVKDKRSVCCTQLLPRVTLHLLVASWNHRISHAAPKSLDHAVSAIKAMVEVTLFFFLQPNPHIL